MRDLKFRAWDTLKKVMIAEGFHVIGEVTMFGEIDNYCLNNHEGKSALDRYGDIEIMQYTGLKDKNGKEIYEGDILSASRTVTGLLLANGKVAEIFGTIPKATRTWDEILVVEIKVNANSISFILPEEGGTYQERGKKLEWEIIGNIYQNPDFVPQT